MDLNTLTVPTLIPVDVNFVLLIYKLYLVSYNVTCNTTKICKVNYFKTIFASRDCNYLLGMDRIISI